MENYIVINGKKAELTEEQLRKLGIVMEKESPFKRVQKGKYHYISYCGNIYTDLDDRTIGDDACYNVANYCTDPNLMQQRAWYETLSRLLWRYSMEHDGNKIKMYDVSAMKYGVKKSCDGTWTTFPTNVQLFGTPMFYTDKVAQNAIEEIIKPFMAEHPDFKW